MLYIVRIVNNILTEENWNIIKLCSGTKALDKLLVSVAWVLIAKSGERDKIAYNTPLRFLKKLEPDAKLESDFLRSLYVLLNEVEDTKVGYQEDGKKLEKFQWKKETWTEGRINDVILKYEAMLKETKKKRKGWKF